MRRPIVTACLCLAAPGATAAAHAQLPRPTGCSPGIHAGEATGTVLLPQGDLFCPRVADPKEPRSFASLLRWRSPDHETTVGAVGIGDSFGIVRWAGATQGNGLQLGVVGSVFAQFDLGTASYDLINADYIIAVPLTFRRGGFTSRLRIYHQSSHLGDEYLLREEPERINLAFESLELILSQELGPVRAYGGAEYLFNREPDDLEERVAHVGAELRAGSPPGVGLVAAVDMKLTEEQEWKPAWSARAGVEIGWGRDPAHPPRVWRILAEFYDGPAPYGQFYRDNIRFYGVGFQLSL
jgi:hypothetical protein